MKFLLPLLLCLSTAAAPMDMRNPEWWPSIERTAASGAPPFSITNAQTLFYVNADDVTVTTNHWIDRMGTADYWSPTSGKSPALVSGGVNSHNYLQFDGTDDYMTNAISPSLKSFHLFLVLAQGGSNFISNAEAFGVVKLGEVDWNSTNSMIYQLDWSGSRSTNLILWNGSGFTARNITNKFYLWELQVSNATWVQQYTNGIVATSNAMSVSCTNPTLTCLAGPRYLPAISELYPCRVSVASVIFYTGIQSGVANIRNFFKTNYNLW